MTIGEIGRPHGVRGESRVYPTGPTLASLTPGTQVSLGATGTDPERVLTVASVRTTSGALLVRWEQCASREDAAALAGRVVQVPASSLAAPADPDEYFVRDLVGCMVRAIPGDEVIGTITAVHEGAANDSLEVAGERGTVLLPFTKDAVSEVDLSIREIHVRGDLLGGVDA